MPADSAKRRLRGVRGDSCGNRVVLRFAYVDIGVGDRAQLVAAAIEDAALESNVVISAWQVSPVGCVVRKRYNFDDLSDRALAPRTGQAAVHDITQRPDLDDACCSKYR